MPVYLLQIQIPAIDSMQTDTQCSWYTTASVMHVAYSCVCALLSAQATPVVASNTPNYDTVIQYVVDSDPFIVEYMDTHVSGGFSFLGLWECKS